MIFHSIILGAGASGLFCARTIGHYAQEKRSVLIVDHNAHPGAKIRISGGAKANFSNKYMKTSFFIGQHPPFAAHALKALPPKALLQFYTQHKLPFEEREHGQYFGLQNAKFLVNALVDTCQSYGYHFALGHTIEHITHSDTLFTVTLKHADTIHTVQSHTLVLALGSSAWPAIGASDAGPRFAGLWNHTSAPFKPVLVPLRLANPTGLAGISLPVRLCVADKIYEEDLLFTHSGLSGPVILQASCYWQKGNPLRIDFAPHISFESLLDARECGKLLVRTLLSRHIPQRLADMILPAELARRKIAELSRAARKNLHACVHEYTITPYTTEGMHKAEAAAGGVLTKDICPHTMESLKQKRLYITGELLDITGQLGGYNLHWAWASGAAAGRHIARL